MTDRSTETSPLIYARVAGLLYLIVIIAGIFAEAFVRQSLIVSGDAGATANNIMASQSLFRVGSVSDLIHMISFLLLPLALYKLLKPVNKNHASLMVIFVIASVPILCLNMVNQFAALLLLSGADYLRVFEPDQLHAQVMLFLDLHRHGYLIAQIFTGLWLLPLGFLVFKSGFLPRILGILLMIATFGYLIETFGNFLFPRYQEIYAWIVAVPAAIGEISFCLWLLIRGVNVQKWENRVPASP